MHGSFLPYNYIQPENESDFELIYFQEKGIELIQQDGFSKPIFTCFYKTKQFQYTALIACLTWRNNRNKTQAKSMVYLGLESIDMHKITSGYSTPIQTEAEILKSEIENVNLEQFEIEN
jgi:hypothetical protein